MAGFLLRRLGASILLLWVVLSVTFAVMHLAPGDPTQLFGDPRIPAEYQEVLRQQFGLDRPLHQQYFRWLKAVAIDGDWGRSFADNRPAMDHLLRALPNSILLALATLLISYGIGIPLGMLAASRAGGKLDLAIQILSTILFAVPFFWLALVAIELFTVRWPILPTNQMSSTFAHELPLPQRILDLLHHLFLPAVTYGLWFCGGVIRFARGGLLETFSQDFIRTARAQGLSETRVLWVHALPNAAGPLVQRLGTSLPSLISSAVIIEVIFSWPGIGQRLFQALQQQDFPVILAGTALSGSLVIAGTLLADVLHAWMDPRVRHG